MNIPTEFLTPTEFEEFSNELVTALFHKEIIGYGEGKDDGIDGTDDIVCPTIVVQSKRYQTRTNPSSFTKIALNEIDKIKETSKKYQWNEDFEYVLITSAELNPASRKTIRDYAGSLMTTDKNIIDGALLKSLSNKDKYEKIFTSYNLKDQTLINLLIENKQESISLESREYFFGFNSKYFVETEALYELYEVLDNERLGIIVGNPGVGKTTTCQMIGNLFSCKNDGEYFIIERNIDEIQNVIDIFNQFYRKDITQKLFVVFDDFLGRTALDTSDKQIKKLRKLYSLVSNSENLYVLLNSRTQILNAAKNEDIEFSQFLEINSNKKITIDISNYSSVEKAYIFRKNIEAVFDSQLSDEKIIMNNKYKDLLKDRNYRFIVNHRNFNPRLISLIALQTLQSRGNYFEYCYETLNNPNQIYEGLFKKLPIEYRFFLINLYCFEEYPVLTKMIESSFNYLSTTVDYDLNVIVRDLEESWITVKNDKTLRNESIDFVNPSIIDFLSNKKGTNNMFKKITQQTKYLSQIKKSSGVNELYNKIESGYDKYCDKDEYVGERISLILEKKKIKERNNFRKLLYKFKGKYYEKDRGNVSLIKIINYTFKSDWGDLIKELYFSDNEEAKDIFLKELLFSKTNEQLIRNILSATSNIDMLAETLDDLMGEICGIRLTEKELTYSEKITGVNLYNEILFHKEEKLQEEVDDTYEIDSLFDFGNLLDSEEDKDFAIDKIVQNYQENIQQGLDNTFFEEKLSTFDLDFSTVTAYVVEQVEDYLFDLANEDVDYQYNQNNLNRTETVDSILGKPLI